MIWSLQRSWWGTDCAFRAVLWLVTLPLLSLLANRLSISNLTWVSTIAVIKSFMTASVVHWTLKIVHRKWRSFLINYSIMAAKLRGWLRILGIKGRSQWMMRVSYATSMWLLMLINFLVPIYLVCLSLFTIHLWTTFIFKPDELTFFTQKMMFAIGWCKGGGSIYIVTVSISWRTFDFFFL